VDRTPTPKRTHVPLGDHRPVRPRRRRDAPRVEILNDRPLRDIRDRVIPRSGTRKPPARHERVRRFRPRCSQRHQRMAAATDRARDHERADGPNGRPASSRTRGTRSASGFEGSRPRCAKLKGKRSSFTCWRHGIASADTPSAAWILLRPCRLPRRAPRYPALQAMLSWTRWHSRE
jgi:hypothetical protein